MGPVRAVVHLAVGSYDGGSTNDLLAVTNERVGGQPGRLLG
ncbi:hypothetical protein ACIBG6_38240 [Streptomyces sp. NPDC050842]